MMHTVEIKREVVTEIAIHVPVAVAWELVQHLGSMLDKESIRNGPGSPVPLPPAFELRRLLDKAIREVPTEDGGLKA